MHTQGPLEVAATTAHLLSASARQEPAAPRLGDVPTEGLLPELPLPVLPGLPTAGLSGVRIMRAMMRSMLLAARYASEPPPPALRAVGFVTPFGPLTPANKRRRSLAEYGLHRNIRRTYSFGQRPCDQGAGPTITWHCQLACVPKRCTPMWQARNSRALDGLVAGLHSFRWVRVGAGAVDGHSMVALAGAPGFPHGGWLLLCDSMHDTDTGSLPASP